jgi:hypothetical protein
MAAFGPAGRAGADTADTITAVSATSPASDLGDLSVTIDSTTQLSALTVHLLNAADQDLLDPAMTLGTPAATATGFETVATVTTPIGLGDLPLGTYTASVDATDAGTSVTGQAAGTLSFVDAPLLTLTVTPAMVSYGNTTVTASGTVTLTHPDGTQGAYSGGSVTLSGGTGGAQHVTTASDGTFSTMMTMPSDGTEALVTAAVAAIAGMKAGSATASVSYHGSPARFVNTRLSQSTINYSGADTLTGTLQYSPDKGTSYRAVPAGVPINVSNSMLRDLEATGTTDSSGNFTIKLPTFGKLTSTWTVTSGNSLLGSAYAVLKMTVKLPVAVSHVKVTLNQYWQLKYSGCLSLTKYIAGASISSTAGLVLQYSSGGASGPWHDMIWKPPVTGYCGDYGVWFSGTTLAPMNLAYYRLHYYGMTIAGTIYPAVNSASVLAWKYADRITNFSVAPRVVAKSAKVTVKGQLQYYANYAWHSYGGQVVEILFRQANTSTWYWIVKVKTNSAGQFSAAVPVAGIGSATWTAQFNGNSTHLATAPPGVYVRVTG